MEQEHNTRDRWLTVDEEARIVNAAPAWLRELMVFAIQSVKRRAKDNIMETVRE
jgi:hypothetical protein